MIRSLICTLVALAIAANAAAELPPDAILEEFGTLDANITWIDESPYAPDGLRVTGFQANSYIRVSFPTPEDPPAGNGLKFQRFVLFANTSTAIDDRWVPLVECHLYEDGEHRLSLGIRPVTQEGGQLLTFYWTANHLSVADGSEVELLIIFHHQLGFIVPLLDAVAWD